MSQKLYLECYAGISGDMTVAALLDLGADEKVLREALESLGLDGYSIEISRVKKSGLDVCDFAVKLDAEHENHDHDMEYLHGHEHEHEHSHGHEHSHEHEHEHSHGHEHSHEHEHEHMHGHDHDPAHLHEHVHKHSHDHGHEHSHEHGHSHAHRGLPEILGIIESSGMSVGAKKRAVRMFDILADAEAKAHGVPRDQVHFHEVGAVDSIVDICAAAVCLDNLGITDVVVPVLYEGCGYVRCQHGVIPVPVPATLNIVQAYGLRLHRTETEGEFVTPTGAAIAAAVRTSDTLPARYTVSRVGLGAGKRNYERPSILRAMLIEESGGTEDCVGERRADVCGRADERGEQAGNRKENGAEKEICKLECNVDDCSGEVLGYAMETLLAAGALEVNYTPVFMKKNRPAYLITVLCRIPDRERMEEILFSETTTIGVRRQRMERSVLKRENKIISTTLGDVNVKVLDLPGEVRYAPEYESVAAIAREHHLPYPRALQMIGAEIGVTEKRGE